LTAISQNKSVYCSLIGTHSPEHPPLLSLNWHPLQNISLYCPSTGTHSPEHLPLLSLNWHPFSRTSPFTIPRLAPLLQNISLYYPSIGGYSGEKPPRLFSLCFLSAPLPPFMEPYQRDIFFVIAAIITTVLTHSRGRHPSEYNNSWLDAFPGAYNIYGRFAQSKNTRCRCRYPMYCCNVFIKCRAL
jgi:hypothetical protein